MKMFVKYSYHFFFISNMTYYFVLLAKNQSTDFKAVRVLTSIVLRILDASEYLLGFLKQIVILKFLT